MTREEQFVWDLSYSPLFSFTHSLLPHPSFLPSFLPNFFISLSFLTFSFLEASFHPSLWPSYCHSSFHLSVFNPILFSFFVPFHLMSPPSFYAPVLPCLDTFLHFLLSALPYIFLCFILYRLSFHISVFHVSLSLPIIIPLTLSVSKVRGKSTTNRKTFHTESNLRHFWNASGSSAVSTQTGTEGFEPAADVCTQLCVCRSGSWQSISTSDQCCVLNTSWIHLFFSMIAFFSYSPLTVSFYILEQCWGFIYNSKCNSSAKLQCKLGNRPCSRCRIWPRLPEHNTASSVVMWALTSNFWLHFKITNWLVGLKKRPHTHLI